MDTINLNTITQSQIYKLVCFYILVLEIIASQTPSETNTVYTANSFFKNLFIRVATLVLIFNTIFNLDTITSLIYSIALVTVFFFVAEK